MLERSYFFILFVFPIFAGSTIATVLCKNCSVSWAEPKPPTPAVNPIRAISLALVGVGVFLILSRAYVGEFPLMCLSIQAALFLLLIVYRLLPIELPSAAGGGGQAPGPTLSHGQSTSFTDRPNLGDGGAVRCSSCGSFGVPMPGPGGRRRCGQCSTPF